MSNLCLCDVCEQIIKEGDNKFVLAINKISQQSENINVVDYESFIEKLKTKAKGIRYYEICETCKNILDKFLAMRKKDMKKLVEQLKSLEDNEDE